MDATMPDLASVTPLLVLITLSLVVLILEAMLKESEAASFWASVAGLAVVITSAVMGMEDSGTAFSGMFRTGGYSNFFTGLFGISALFTIILSRDYLRKAHSNFGEFYLLVIFSLIGMVMMAGAGDLIMLFLGLELMSICLYVLVGFIRRGVIHNESSLKYFLLGAFATGFLLYGIALLYGATGSTNIGTILSAFPVQAGSLLYWGGLGLLMVGFAFKVGAVPFHMWIPDVYHGAPTTVTGFMATGAKAAAFAAFILVFASNVIDGERLKTALAFLAAASMILGNVVAIAQTNIKRMLAYSSVAHAGYMLVGLAAGNTLGKTGILFYLVSYLFTNIGAFGILSLLEREEEGNLTFSDYAGMGSQHPFLAALMTIFMISLAGIPPFGGFFGKYYVFVAAIHADLTWLTLIGVLTSLVSVYYYLRLVMMMYFREGTMASSGTPSTFAVAVLLVAAIAVLQLGIFPSSLLLVIQQLL